MKKKRDTHHIIPKSRLANKQEEELVGIDRDRHELYHILFSNKTPEEICQALNEEFWGDKYKITIRRKT